MRSISILSLGALASCASPLLGAPLQTVALTNQPAPDLSGRVFHPTTLVPFFQPVINAAGDITFAAVLQNGSSTTSAIYTGTPGNIHPLVYQGQSIAGVAPSVGYVGNLFVYPTTNGNYSFAGETDVPTAQNPRPLEGIYFGSPGNLQLVAATNDHAPDTPADVIFSWRDGNNHFGSNPFVGGANQILFASALQGPGVTSANNFAYFSGTPGDIHLLARLGDTAPGTDGVFANLTRSTLNSSGRATFFGSLTGGTVSTVNDTALWVGTTGTVQVLAREDVIAPDTGGAQYSDFTGLRALQNNAGQIAFRAGLKGTGVDSTNVIGLFTGTPGDVHLKLRMGESAPEVGAGIAVGAMNIAEPVLNVNGNIAVQSAITGPGVIAGTDNTVLWFLKDASRHLVLRKNNPAPGAPDGAKLNSINNVVVNGNDQMLILAWVTGLTTGHWGLYGWTESSGIQLQVLTGDTVEVAPGDFRTISEIAPLADTGLGEGFPPSFNNAGQFVVHATFTDGSHGVFRGLLTVPEPVAISVIGLLAIPAVRRVRRR